MKNKFENKIHDELYSFSEIFSNQLDLKKENCIPLEYDLDKIIGKFRPIDYKIKFNDFLAIIFRNNSGAKSISTRLSQKELEIVYKRIVDNNINSFKKMGSINTYLSLGSIKYEEDFFPCFLIPILIKRDKYSYKLYRNYNQEIHFNICLKMYLEYYGIDLPTFKGDISDYINKIKNVESIEFIEEAFVCNYNVRFNHVFNDLEGNDWELYQNKIEQYFRKNDMLSLNEIDILKKDLKKDMGNFRIKSDQFLLKALIFKGKSILIIANESTRKNIENSFYNDCIDVLLLNLSDELSKNDFYRLINNNYKYGKIKFSEEILDKYKKLSEIINLINKKFSNFNLTPLRIKIKKDYYLEQIISLNLKKYDCQFENARYYDKVYYENMEKQIKGLFLNFPNINLTADFIDYLYSKQFNIMVNIFYSLENDLNEFIHDLNEFNKKYKINNLNNLFEISKLNYLSDLYCNPKYVEKEEFYKLNQIIKNYDDSSNEFGEEFKEIERNIKYTYLLDSEVITMNSVDLILDDFVNVDNLSKYLIGFSKFLIKQFRYILKFYKKFDYFTVDSSLLTIFNDFDNLKKLLYLFKIDMKDLINFKEYYDSLKLEPYSKKFLSFVFENGYVNLNECISIYWYNIYNSILNEFLKDYEFIEENKIISKYEIELNKLKRKANISDENLLIDNMYSKIEKSINSSVISNQKKNLIQNYKNGKLDTIKNMLSDYREFITNYKRVFMMDITMVSQLLGNSYENYFDYVIITENVDFYELDKCSLLLRSNSKLILLGDLNE